MGYDVYKKGLACEIILLFMVASIVPSAIAIDDSEIHKSLIKKSAFSKGVSWQPIVPMKKVAFVNFDKNSLLDDYAYLASIPAAVFSDGETLFSHPLLFFQPEDTYSDEDEYRFLNDYQGTHYLMEDWMGYSSGKLDKLTAINVDKSDLDPEWVARDAVFIEGENPFAIAGKIALNDWSYTDTAVIAVIEGDFEKPMGSETSGSVTGVVSGEIATEQIKVKRPYGPAPEFERFEIGEEYKYVRVDLWYPSVVVDSKLLGLVPGFPGIVTIPSIDPDLQLYMSYEGDWMQTAAISHMTITAGPLERVFSYVYTPGLWRVGVTNMPTQGPCPEPEHYLLGRQKGKFLFYGNTLEAIRNALGKPLTEYNCDINMYPGVEVEIPDNPPFGCRDATFKLTWDNSNINLGLSIIGPYGEEIESVFDEESNSQEIHFDQLGECLDDEHYNVVVYALDDVPSPTDFTVGYSWNKNISKKQADCIASACEGAVLSSIVNAPLLYTTSSNVPSSILDVIYKLGVNEIYILDLGGYLSNEALTQLSNAAVIKEHFTEYDEIYTDIMTKTGSNDVIFSTIDPWSYWHYVEKSSELKPYGKFDKAFYFAPATYAAAHHGSPLLLVDNHHELSKAVVVHNEFWKKHAQGNVVPPVAPLFLTGSKVYEFLREHGFDKEGKESILTVAGQYDIGPTWTRMFAGIANPGAIIGTPIDSSNWISRCVFYPALIFENPALQGEVELVNGSKSIRSQPSLIPFRPFQGLRQRLRKPFGSNLNIIKESKPEKYRYPVLHTYGCYGHRFNERGSKYWDAEYQTRDGIIPGRTISAHEIDEGTREKFEGLSGSFYADISESEITPFYASKAGYENAFSMNYEITLDNLNQGVISWYMVLHGHSNNGGWLSWYSPTSVSDLLESSGMPTAISKIVQFFVGIPLGLHPTTEVNPWRGYDQLWGSTEEPDSASMNAEIGLFLGILGLGRRDGPLHGGLIKTGLDLVPTNIPLLKFNRKNYFDGLVGPYSITAMISKFTYAHTATEVDDKLENLHSMSFHADSCLIGCNYLQIAFMRHGSVLQELDPWGTSYWGGFVFQEIPKDLALGKTVGESYSEGRAKVGIKYLFENDEPMEWWWDEKQNTVLFSDPDVRVWIPSTEWDQEARNHWERDDIQPLRYDEDLSIDGHMPFGVKGYPHEKTPNFWEKHLWIVTAVMLIITVIGIICISCLKRKVKKSS